MRFAAAEQIADVVLYEGYVLYPYRASSAKNRVRWQFGVIAPASPAGDGEPSVSQTECLVEPEPGRVPSLVLRVRFLQIQARTLEDATGAALDRVDAGGQTLVPWDEGVLRTIDIGPWPLALDCESRAEWPVEAPAGREVDSVVPTRAENATDEARGAELTASDVGVASVAPAQMADDSADAAADAGPGARVVRTRAPIDARLSAVSTPTDGFIRVTVRLENLAAWAPEYDASRDAMLRRSLVGAHVLLAIDDGRFVSLLDPPPAAKSAVAACRNRHTWPVLVGPPGSRGEMLSSPIVLYDYPAVAPESAGDLCDGTEIDEILSLRILTLTDDEKREARATDPRARAIIDRTEALAPAAIARLHGTRRSPDRPAPAAASVVIGHAVVTTGSRVRLRPARRADAMDMFLANQAATVTGVYRTFEDRVYVAVTVDADPAADVQGRVGRYFYFHPDELDVIADEAKAVGAP